MENPLLGPLFWEYLRCFTVGSAHRLAGRDPSLQVTVPRNLLTAEKLLGLERWNLMKFPAGDIVGIHEDDLGVRKKNVGAGSLSPLP